ncbi:MAG: reverse transcriptase-like protein [Armatimonadetes bacterium]|nr:reverse transcriptase-like protein [Armatimonadota bacterium]
MAREAESKQLLYAMTSGHTAGSSDIAGIAVIIKAARHHTLRKISATVPTNDRITAAYEAISAALREAREMGARALIVYTDCEAVIGQLNRTVTVGREQLARHLETRCLLNQFHRAEVAPVAPAQNEAARRLAVEAWQREVEGGGSRQLELPMAAGGAS